MLNNAEHQRFVGLHAREREIVACRGGGGAAADLSLFATVEAHNMIMLLKVSGIGGSESQNVDSADLALRLLAKVLASQRRQNERGRSGDAFAA